MQGKFGYLMSSIHSNVKQTPVNIAGIAVMRGPQGN